MKIKEICEKTGLTDRTVRYYIEEQLITPFYTENYLGRKSFNFSEEDLDRLKDIATLRAFGFSVEEIKQLSMGEGDNREIVEAVKRRSGESLEESRRRLNALSSLEPTDHVDLSNLAQRLSNTATTVENETAKLPMKKRILSGLRACAVFLAVWLPILSAITVLIVKFSTLHMPFVRPAFLVYTLLCLLPSMITVLVFQRLKGSKNMLRILLTTLCVLCLPLSVLFSSKSVIVCDHHYEEYRTIAEPTCLREGERVMKCTVCKRLETQPLEKLPHLPTVIKGVAPTCAQEGLSDEIHCSVCHTVLEKQVPIPKTKDHSPVPDAAVPATCQDTGLTEGTHCSVCNEVFLAQAIVPRTDVHEPVIDVAIPATCQRMGLTEGSHCAVCNKILVARVLVPKTDSHTPVADVAVPATCQHVGLTEGSHCAVCQKVLVAQITLSKLTHEYEGIRCTRCGDYQGSKGLVFVRVGAEYAVSGFGSCRDEVLVIPSTHNDLPVTQILTQSLDFSESDYSPREIIIPSSVQKIQYAALVFNKFIKITVGNGRALEQQAICASGGCELMLDSLANLPSNLLGYPRDFAPYVIREATESICEITEDGFVFIQSDNQYYLCDYIGTATNLTLPDRYRGSTYVVAPYCFYKNTVVSHVTVGNGVTNMGGHTFAYSSLESIDLNGQLRELPIFGFMGCQSLESIVIPDNITSIAHQCFYESGIRNATIGKNVTAINGSVFSESLSLDTLYYHAVNCTYLSHTALHGFKKVVIGASVQQIPAGFMQGNTALEVVIFEENSVCESIGGGAFNQTSIREITLPPSIVRLSKAFDSCSRLQKIHLLCEELQVIASSGFYDCGYTETGITIIVGPAVRVLPSKFILNSHITGLIFESGSQCKIIQKDFSNSRLSGIILPDSIESFDPALFDLKTLTLNQNYVMDGGCLISVKEAKLLCVLDATYTIPAYVTTIAKGAFYGSGAKHIAIPDTVLTIEKGALACPTVESISLPFIGTDRSTPVMLLDLFGSDLQHGWIEVTLPVDTTHYDRYYVPPRFSKLTVRGNALSDGLVGLSMLEELWISQTVESVSEAAVKDCTQLTAIYFGGTQEQWDALKSSGWLSYVPMSVTLVLNAEIDS